MNLVIEFLLFYFLQMTICSDATQGKSYLIIIYPEFVLPFKSLFSVKTHTIKKFLITRDDC